MQGDTLVFIVILGVLAYIAGRLLERKYGPFPEGPEVEPPWWDPPWWWWIPLDEEEDRWPRSPLDRHPFDPFDEDRR